MQHFAQLYRDKERRLVESISDIDLGKERQGISLLRRLFVSAGGPNNESQQRLNGQYSAQNNFTILGNTLGVPVRAMFEDLDIQKMTEALANSPFACGVVPMDLIQHVPVRCPSMAYLPPHLRHSLPFSTLQGFISMTWVYRPRDQEPLLTATEEAIRVRICLCFKEPRAASSYFYAILPQWSSLIPHW